MGKNNLRYITIILNDEALKDLIYELDEVPGVMDGLIKLEALSKGLKQKTSEIIIE